MKTPAPRKTGTKSSGSGSARQTLQRHWNLLHMIPHAPGTITVPEICSRLDPPTTARTVQRDLQDLMLDFPLVYDGEIKPYGWSWLKGAPRLSLPGLSTQEALTLAMAQQNLATLLPPATMKELKPLFDEAGKTLAAQPGLSRKSWPERVRALPPSQPLIPPELRPEVQSAVYDAVLTGRQLDVSYQSRSKGGESRCTLHPLALVQRGPVTYLVCTFFTYTDIRLIALHRIRKADVLDARASRPSDFSLDALIAEGKLGFGQGEQIELVVDFHEDSGEHLFETRLCADQHLERIGEGLLRLSATVPLNQELRWWLLGFGGKVEVIAPASLRSEIAATLEAGAKRYRS